MGDWSYRGVGARDLRLDYLRGLCLIKMVFNHLWHTPVHAIQHWLGFVTAAEGFFFISGVVVGIVHGRRSRQLGLGATSRQMLQRSTQLYIANLALVFLFISLEAAQLLSFDRFQILWRDSLEWSQLFAFGQPYYLHVLPRYVAFLALTPLALWALVKGRSHWILLAAGAAYGINLAAGGMLWIPWLERSGFPILAWQLLFFTGLWVGEHRQRIGAWWRRWNPRWRTPRLLALFLAFVVYKQGLMNGLWTGSNGSSLLFSRDALGPLRLVNLAVAFALLFDLVDRCWRPLERFTGAFVLPIGQASLYVFLMHIPLVWIAKELLLRNSPPLPADGWILLGDLLLLGLLWVMVRRRFLFTLVPR